MPDSYSASTPASACRCDLVLCDKSSTVVTPAFRAPIALTNVAAYMSSGRYSTATAFRRPRYTGTSTLGRMRRSCPCHMWRWASTNPGITIMSVASITRSDWPASRAGPICFISSPLIRTSAWTKSPTAGSMLITHPFCSNRRRSAASLASDTSAGMTDFPEWAALSRFNGCDVIRCPPAPGRSTPGWNPPIEARIVRPSIPVRHPSRSRS